MRNYQGTCQWRYRMACGYYAPQSLNQRFIKETTTMRLYININVYRERVMRNISRHFMLRLGRYFYVEFDHKPSGEDIDEPVETRMD